MMPYDRFRQIQTIDIQEVHVFLRGQFDRLTTTTAARVFRVRVGLPPHEIHIYPTQRTRLPGTGPDPASIWSVSRCNKVRSVIGGEGMWNLLCGPGVRTVIRYETLEKENMTRDCGGNNFF